MKRAPKRAPAERAPAERDESPFEVVQRLVRAIPAGEVATYGQLSRLIARRLTPIGVGWAVRAAPEGSVPWQRVVNAQGGISTDDRHPGLQREMLESEGVVFDARGRIDLERFGWRPDQRAKAAAGSPSRAPERSGRSSYRRNR